MVGPYIDRLIDRYIDTCVRNAVTLVWGSLRLAPIIRIQTYSVFNIAEEMWHTVVTYYTTSIKFYLAQ